MKFFITPQGNVEAVYNDVLTSMGTLGSMEVNRASNVEYNHNRGLWEAHTPDGTLIASGVKRNDVLAEEVKVIEQKLRSSL